MDIGVVYEIYTAQQFAFLRLWFADIGHESFQSRYHSVYVSATVVMCSIKAISWFTASLPKFSVLSSEADRLQSSVSTSGTASVFSHLNRPIHCMNGVVGAYLQVINCHSR